MTTLRVDRSKQFLELCGDEPAQILERIVTGDETWVHQFEPELKISDDNEAKEAILAHFEAKDKKYFYDGLEKMIHRSNKCIQLKGGFIEKEK